MFSPQYLSGRGLGFQSVGSGVRFPIGVPVNQCDGCRRGLPIENGIHYDKGWPDMSCTADRYAPVAQRKSVSCNKLEVGG